MAPDVGILNKILEQFTTTLSVGVKLVGSDAMSLLGVLATMELLIGSLWWAYSGSEALGRFVRKALSIFFFIWIVQNYTNILSWVLEGFVWTGERAAGGISVNIEDPSGIFHQGFIVVDSILKTAKSNLTFYGGGMIDMLITLICTLVILLAYFIVAVQILLTRIEFAIVSTLGLILIPFGVFKYTSFMAEKVFGAVISYGIKFMILAFIVAVGFPLMEQLSLPPDPSWPEMFNVMFGSLAMALISIHGPGISSALISGGPSLTAGAAVGTTMALGGAAAGATVAGGVGAAGALKAIGATKGTVKGAAALKGVGSALYGEGKKAAQTGSGPSAKVNQYSKAAGAVSGTVGAAGRVAGSTVMAQKQRIKESLKSSYSRGKTWAESHMNSKYHSFQAANDDNSSNRGQKQGNFNQNGSNNNTSDESFGNNNTSQGFNGNSSNNNGFRKHTNGTSSRSYKARKAAHMANNGTQSSSASAGMGAKVRFGDEDD